MGSLSTFQRVRNSYLQKPFVLVCKCVGMMALGIPFKKIKIETVQEAYEKWQKTS